VLAASLGYNPAALECVVVDEGHQVPHGGDGAMDVDLRGGCRFGNLYTFGIAWCRSKVII
jgi:hypothetical protein